ncbi:MAG: CDP-glucose 4,6-dehydratase [Rhodospirillales bacterium]|nr:CDP-glucose 4,6-dehydratase [Rhodospirillales bacterium]|tara:strand:- start:16341 stop:17414 length:1074 start_codon:yes stop_codon:yes gene_type:complete
MDLSFWRNKSVFITGHTGFKGSWLTFWLHQLGAVVKGYALAPTSSQTLYESLSLDKKITSVFSDISDLPCLQKEINLFQPEIVFHLAAQPLVQYSFHDPYETFKTNVLGTVSLLEAVRHCPSVRAVVVVTTDKCYQNNEWVWPYRENDRLGGDDPYSSSKACAELATDAFYKSFFSSDLENKNTCAVASARAGNVIGGGDWAEKRLIPDLIRSIENGNSLILRNPMATRPWQFVLEPLRGYLKLAQQLFKNGKKYSGGWNFGPRENESQPVEWVVNQLYEALGVSCEWEISEEKHFKEKQMLCLDISKAEQALEWVPVLSIAESIKYTADWYACYLSGGDLLKITKNQIESYEGFLN